MKRQQTGKSTGLPSFLSVFSPQRALRHAHEDLMIFSPVRWEQMRRRPQHIASLLSHNHRILYVEEPLPQPDYTPDTRRTFNPLQNLTVIQPYSALNTEHYDYTSLIQTYIENGAIDPHPAAWFYSSDFMDILHFQEPSFTVFDSYAPDLSRNDEVLVSYSDIVFAAGEHMFDRMRKLNGNVHLIPNAVDESHFRKSRDTETVIAHDLLDIPIPRVGYIGTLDNRIDMELLKGTARSLPHVSFVCIGPVSPGTRLPDLPNVFHLGFRPYEQLPNYLKGIDIAIAPYDVKTSARFASPHKILEYMASGKPVISTPVYGVIRDFGHEVEIAADAEETASVITRLLNENAAEKLQRLRRQEQAVTRTSWIQAVARIEEAIGEFEQSLQT